MPGADAGASVHRLSGKRDTAFASDVVMATSSLSSGASRGDSNRAWSTRNENKAAAAPHAEARPTIS